MGKAAKGGRRKKGKRKHPAKRGFFSRYWLEFFLGVLFFAIIAVAWSIVSEERVDQGTVVVQRHTGDEVFQPDEIIDEPGGAEKNRVSVVPSAIPPHPHDRAPVISIIIDDLGASVSIAKQLMELGRPIAFSILPHLKHSKAIALEARQKGHVVLLHLPMEPKSASARPGAGALTLKMDAERIENRIRDDINSVPGAEGVNNHMGSLFTENREKMSITIGLLKKRGLFFVDSRTTAGTVAYEIAVKMGMPTAKRDVFLDNERDTEKIKERVIKLANKAIRKGSAIGIGHPYPETISALRESIPILHEMGVRIVPVTALLRDEPLAKQPNVKERRARKLISSGQRQQEPARRFSSGSSNP